MGQQGSRRRPRRDAPAGGTSAEPRGSLETENLSDPCGNREGPGRTRTGAEDPLDLGLGYVDRARVVRIEAGGELHKALVVELSRPMALVSTLEGPRQGIRTVVNHGLPPGAWRLDLEGMRRLSRGLLGLEAGATSCLFTGADLDHLSVQCRSFEGLKAVALVSAGVEVNAMRASRDEGAYLGVGTVNAVVLMNARLSPRAMTRAVAMATEAKTAAFQDMDVRSTRRPGRWQATGTGTDNVVVVEGCGPAVDSAGGHTRAGQLIAEAVYRGVREAVERQNGLSPARDVAGRLYERGLVPDALAPGLAEALLALLQGTPWAGFVECAMAVSDAYERGLVRDLTWFQEACYQVAAQVAGRPIDEPAHGTCPDTDVPAPLSMALNALLAGLAVGDRRETESGRDWAPTSPRAAPGEPRRQEDWRRRGSGSDCGRR